MTINRYIKHGVQIMAILAIVGVLHSRGIHFTDFEFWIVVTMVGVWSAFDRLQAA